MSESISLDGDRESPVLITLQFIVRETEYWSKFNMFDSVLSTIESEKVDTKKIKKWLRTIALGNVDFIRKFEHFKKVTEQPETGELYFGRDYPSHPEFNFDKEFMEKLITINLKINDTVGILIQELSAEDDIEF